MQYKKLVEVVRKKIKDEYPTQYAYARHIGIPNSNVTTLLRQEPGFNSKNFDRILKDIGYERVVEYRRV